MQVWLSVWAAVGPLLGVILGSYLSLRGQKRQWISDNKKQEYRELLTTLTQAFGDIVSFNTPKIAHSPEEQRAYAETEKKAGVVILDRIFIARELREMDLARRWTEATRAVDHDRNLTAFAERFSSIVRDVTSAAMRIVD